MNKFDETLLYAETYLTYGWRASLDLALRNKGLDNFAARLPALSSLHLLYDKIKWEMGDGKIVEKQFSE